MNRPAALVGLWLVWPGVGGCAVPSLPGTAAPSPAPASAAPAPAPPSAARSPRAAVSKHTRFGFWGMNGHLDAAGLQRARSRFGSTVVHTATVSPGYALHTLLPLARSQGVSVSLRMTGDHGRYTGPLGGFDLDGWRAVFAPWAAAGPDLAPFIEDGTLIAHMLLDDIHNFAGSDPTAAELDEMARLSRAALPGLLTFVREKATAMPAPASGRYAHVDAVVHQYRHREGPVRAWSDAQAARARALDLGVICGLNIANGGDGTSGQAGWANGRFAMSGAEIERHGAVLADEPSCGLFLAWEYDAQERWSDGSIGADWFDQPAQQAALAALAARVAARPAAPLRRQ